MRGNKGPERINELPKVTQLSQRQLLSPGILPKDPCHLPLHAHLGWSLNSIGTLSYPHVPIHSVNKYLSLGGTERSCNMEKKKDKPCSQEHSEGWTDTEQIVTQPDISLKLGWLLWESKKTPISLTPHVRQTFGHSKYSACSSYVLLPPVDLESRKYVLHPWYCQSERQGVKGNKIIASPKSSVR